jgi:hypothetical protein
MRGNTSNILILLCLLLFNEVDAKKVTNFNLGNTTLNSDTVVAALQNTSPTKKAFKKEAYDKIKEEVELIEKMAQKTLKEDSSNFGLGYGVERGGDYVIYSYDSITGQEMYVEKQRGSGSRNAGDGVHPDARSYQKNRKEFRRRSSFKSERNRRENVNKRDLKRKESTWRDSPRGDRDRKYNDKSSVSISDDFFKLLFILIIAVILGYAAFMLFLNNPVGGDSHKILYDQEMNPERVQLSELERKINSAKDNNDFRGATRLYFIWVIKELSDRRYIFWKKRKTNYNYLLEVQKQNFQNEFERAVKNYEFIWYGKYEIGKMDFDEIEKHFKGLIVEIKEA